MAKLTKRQLTVLSDVLHTLDINNNYLSGDRLRLAFGVELKGLQTPGRDEYTRNRDVFSDHGMERGQVYHVKGEQAEFRKAWKGAK